MLVEREVGDQPFEPGVLLLHLPQSEQFTYAEMGVLLFPGIEGGVTDPELPAEITDGSATLGLSVRIDDLLFGKFRPLHRSTPFARDRRSRHLTLVLKCRRFSGRRQQQGEELDWWLDFKKITNIM